MCSSDLKIISASEINHFDLHTKKEISSNVFLPTKHPVHILLTSGASCPDALVENVIERILGLLPGADSIHSKLEQYQA